MIVLYLAAIVLSTWGALFLAGLPVMLHLTRERQEMVLPALPVLGAMVLVVLTHWPAMFVATPTALIISSAVLAGIAAHGWLRGGRLHVTRRRVLTLVVAVALGAVPASLALLPALELDRPRLIQPTLNNDAFAYVTLSSWLRENPALEVPEPVGDPPVYGYARSHLTLGLRLGEEFLHVGAAILNGRDVASTWFVVLCTWMLMLPGAFWASTRMLRLRSWMGLVGGFVAGTSAVLLSQVYNQNSAAVLGLAMAPLVVVALGQGLDRSDWWPRWFPALTLAGLAGAYTELLPVLFPGLMLFALARSPRHYLPVVRRGLVLAGIAFVVSPFIWRNVVRSLLVESGVTAPGVQSSFIHAPGLAILNRLVGLTSLDGASLSRKGLLLLGLVLIGLIGSGLDRSLRRHWLPITGGCLAVVGYLTFVHRFPYGQQRAVQVSVPLVLLTSAAGFATMISRLWSELLRVGPTSIAALASIPLAVSGAAFPLTNAASSVRWEREFHVAARSVDPSLLEGVTWVQELDRRGSDTMIVNSNFFEQLWLTYELRHQEQLAWPVLYPDYMHIDRYARWDGRLRRFALVGRDDYVDADVGVIVRENARFRLLDLSLGDALIAIPSVNWGGGERTAEGVAHWMGNVGEMVVIRTPGALVDVVVEGGAMPDLAPLTLSVLTAEREGVAELSVPADLTEHRLPLPDRGRVLLFFVNAQPARQPSSGDDPRLLSFYLSDVRRG